MLLSFVIGCDIIIMSAVNTLLQIEFTGGNFYGKYRKIMYGLYER